MERHRRDTEAQPGHHHDQGHHAHPRQGRISLSGGESADQPRQIRRARQTVEIAEAEQRQRRREHAEEEILHRRFLRGRIESASRHGAAAQVEDNVGRNTRQFQGEEQRHEFVGRPGQAHAGDDEEQAAVIVGRLVLRHRLPAEQHEDDAAGDRHGAEEQGEPIEQQRTGIASVSAAVPVEVRQGRHPQDRARGEQRREGQPPHRWRLAHHVPPRNSTQATTPRITSGARYGKKLVKAETSLAFTLLVLRRFAADLREWIRRSLRVAADVRCRSARVRTSARSPSAMRATT